MKVSSGQGEHKGFLDWLENQGQRNLYLLVERLVAAMLYPWVCQVGVKSDIWSKLSIIVPLLWIRHAKIYFFAGLVNYCVPAGEARQKALEIARDINHKVNNHLYNRFFHPCLIFSIFGLKSSPVIVVEILDLLLAILILSII